MSGATSAVPSAGAIQARQRTAPSRTASSGWASPRSQAARSRKPIETRAWLANSRTRGVAQELEQRPGGPALAQPAEGDGGGAPVAGVLVGEHPDEVGDELLAPQRGLHLGVEALAGGGRPLLDLHHRADRGVAQRRVGVEEVGRDARRAPRGRPRGRGPRARARAASRRRAGRGAPGPRAGRRSRRGRGAPGTAATARRAARRRAGARPRGEPICPRLVAAAWRTFTSGSESASTRAADRGRLLHRAEHHRGEEPHLLVGVARAARAAARVAAEPEPHVDLHRRVARARVVAVAQRRLERGQERLGREAGERLDRGLPHRPALVAHRHEQRRRSPRGGPERAELRDRPAPRGLLAAARSDLERRPREVESVTAP